MPLSAPMGGMGHPQPHQNPRSAIFQLYFSGPYIYNYE